MSAVTAGLSMNVLSLLMALVAMCGAGQLIARLLRIDEWTAAGQPSGRASEAAATGVGMVVFAGASAGWHQLCKFRWQFTDEFPTVGSMASWLFVC